MTLYDISEGTDLTAKEKKAMKDAIERELKTHARRAGGFGQMRRTH